MRILVQEERNLIHGIPFYRTVIPYAELARQYGLILDFIDAGDHIPVADILKYDLIVLRRPSTDVHLAIIQYCKYWGTNVIVDLDDDLASMSIANENKGTWDERKFEMLWGCLREADAVTVTTENLKAALTIQLGRYEGIHVIPNAWPGLQELQPNFIHDKIRVYWRGSRTHIKDINYYDDIFKRINDSEDHYLHFFGFNPGKIDWNPDKTSGPMAFADYMQRLNELKFNFLFFPLEDSTFNHSKSNISWIEATATGAAAIIPKLRGRHWAEKGMLHDPEILFKPKDEINKIIAESVRASQKVIKQKYDLKTVNEKRMRLLDSLKPATIL